MLPNKEKLNSKIEELSNYYNVYNPSLMDLINDYNKWYAEQLLNHTVEMVKVKMVKHAYIGVLTEVDKESILNILNEI